MLAHEQCNFLHSPTTITKLI